MEDRVIALTNAQRRARGCASLRPHSYLRNSARGHTVTMALKGVMSHQLPGEPRFSVRITRAGYTNWRIVAENVARGFSGPSAVVRAWMASPGHRRNILNCKLRHIGVVNDRDHRKLIVIDGRVALVGGHCIVDSWLGNAENRERVRDLAVRLRGPVVHGVQSVFSENWVEDTGELFLGDAFFPPLERCGDVALHVASVKAEGSPPAVKILHHLAVCVAKRRIRIQNPYFLPDDEAIDALCKAVARGVDVRVMVPSTDASDMPLVQHAAHRNFDRLLEGGVRIFEYQTCLLHQKVMTVDGHWSAIGSSNFDDRSFETNDEITLGFLDPRLARQMEEIFERDRAHCVELDAKTWARRGLRHRIADHAWYLFNEVL